AMFHVKQDSDLGVLREGDWAVVNKIDLVDAYRLEELRDILVAQGLRVIELAARKPGGAEAARAALTDCVVDALSGAEFPAATRIRHAESLTEARTYLRRALSDVGLEVELAAEDVRLAARSLSRITGRIDPEDVLDRVFSSFCIGK
ncbi:MAG: tRNA uridine-5-carboxymethylaminomethyl(34) synthesis GTPase MnmE, partial [Caulobacter sp.]|nr:tRNA uridine-5-carboxymethylaminomethyl(34) synthesis GTPase MnmE [Caulobacter sp.]